MLQGKAKAKWEKLFPGEMWPLERAGDQPDTIETSDEYKALMELRKRFPAEYDRLATREPKTISECVDLVNSIEEAVDG